MKQRIGQSSLVCIHMLHFPNFPGKVLTASFHHAHESIIAMYPTLTNVRSYDGRVWHLVKGKEGQMNYVWGPNNSLQDFGTTAVAVLVRVIEGVIANIIVANTGDSLAFIGRDTGAELIGEDITVRHSVEVCWHLFLLIYDRIWMKFSECQINSM